MSTQTRRNDPLNLPQGLPFDREGRGLEYVGPSMRGHVYREASGNRYFRLLPIEDVRDLSKRLEIDKRRDQPCRQGLAPIEETGEVPVRGSLFFFVTYRANGRSLSGLLTDADPQSRLFLMSKVMGALNNWWETNGDANFPMPADIVFNQQWPVLLALPSLGLWPRFETLVAEPSRVPFLAPELVRGSRQLIRDRTLDLFACGVMMLQCLFAWKEPDDPFLMLRKAASGTLFEPEGLLQRMPIWIDRVDLYPEVVRMVRTALDPDPRTRADANPAQLSEKLRLLADRLDPLAVAEDLRGRKQYQKAVDFIGDVCLGESRFDLLLLAGKIAMENLQEPLNALEWFERAIQAAPAGNLEAQRLQLSVLLQTPPRRDTAGASKSLVDTQSKMHAMALRNFQSLPVRERDTLFMAVTSFFMKAGQFIQAQEVLHPYLYHPGTSGAPPTYMWWEFPRTLLYAEAMIGEIPAHPEKFDAARTFLDGIKKALSTVARYPASDPRRLDPSLIEVYGNTILRLEKMMAAVKK
ncbi:serine/threonine protein kinase [bacterium]|nr:serine/threonine protein kinase [bacterium]